MRVRALLVAVVFGFLAGVAHGQPATPANSILWDQGGPDLATVNGYTFKYYPDGAAAGITFPAPVVCTGTVSPFTCKVPYPAFTPGAHTIIVTASNVAGESAKTGTLSFTFAVVPTAPANLRSGH
jgi:hypothetical protein